ncbi:hypothetical protein IBX38_09170 [Candidatus Bathyarchaeota archaeon]|nr:hypothetical protein [Candidatus Bathyarchaeota archaeon]
MNERYAFIIMIKEKWWNEFRRLNRSGRTTHCYVQGGWAPPKNAKLLFFYVVRPIGEIQGYAEFIERKVGKMEALWKEYRDESCLSDEQYDDLMRGRLNVTFIRFENLWEASKPIPLNNILMLLGINRMSRKGFYIDKVTADKLIEVME